MFPAFGLLWVVVYVVRYALGRKNPKRAPSGRVLGPGLAAVPRWRWALFAGGPLAALWILVSSSMLGAHAIPFLLVVLVVLVAASPLLAKWIAVPLGLPRLACIAYRVAGGVGTVHERPGSAALVAARAFMRRPREQDARFIEAYLQACLEMGTEGAAASAILAAWRGDREQATSIARLLAWTDAPCAAGAKRFAREYVAVEALNQGNWRWLPRAEDLHEWTHSRWMALLEAPPSLPVAPVAPTFAAHASLLARSAGAVREEDVVAAVLSLDQLRASGPWRARIEQRALALGLSVDSRSMEDQAMREAEQDIASVLLAGDHRALWAPQGTTGDAVRALVNEERLRQAESLVGELGRRTREARDLPESEEWRAWADAKHACLDLQRDGVDPATVFSIAFHTMTAYAVRLVNVRSRRVLAREVFTYARTIAQAAEAMHVLEIAGRNVRAMEAYRLPNQPGIEGILISDRKRVAWASLRSLTVIPALIVVSILVIALATETLPLAALLVVAGLAALWMTTRIFECAHTREGLVFQGRYGRYVAAPEDILSVQSGPGPFLRIRLRRVPFGFPRRLLTIAKSNDHARAHAERVRTELRLQSDPATPRIGVAS